MCMRAIRVQTNCLFFLHRQTTNRKRQHKVSGPMTRSMVLVVVRLCCVCEEFNNHLMSICTRNCRANNNMINTDRPGDLDWSDNRRCNDVDSWTHLRNYHEHTEQMTHLFPRIDYHLFNRVLTKFPPARADRQICVPNHFHNRTECTDARSNRFGCTLAISSAPDWNWNSFSSTQYQSGRVKVNCWSKYLAAHSTIVYYPPKIHSIQNDLLYFVNHANNSCIIIHVCFVFFYISTVCVKRPPERRRPFIGLWWLECA